MTHKPSWYLLAAAGLALALGATLGPAHAQSAKNSCVGAEACAGNNGTVGKNSCNGIKACFDNQGEVNKNSCNDNRA